MHGKKVHDSRLCVCTIMPPFIIQIHYGCTIYNIINIVWSFYTKTYIVKMYTKRECLYCIRAHANKPLIYYEVSGGPWTHTHTHTTKVFRKRSGWLYCSAAGIYRYAAAVISVSESKVNDVSYNKTRNVYIISAAVINVRYEINDMSPRDRVDHWNGK